MFLFKTKKPIEPEKQASQVNEDLELVTKMNQEFAVSLDLNDTLKTALQVIIARLNAEAANIFLINEKIGKILIDNEYPFGVFKFNNKSIDFNKIYNTETAEIKIIKPEWIN